MFHLQELSEETACFRRLGHLAWMSNPFRYFKTSPEIICLAVMMYIRFPLSLRNVEDLLHERGIDISCETKRSPRGVSSWSHNAVRPDF